MVPAPALGPVGERADVPPPPGLGAAAHRTADPGGRTCGHRPDHRGRGDGGAAEDQGPAVHRIGPPLHDAAPLVHQERASADVAGLSAPCGARVGLVVAADLLHQLEADRDEDRWPARVLGGHPGGDHRIEGQHATRTGQEERDPGEQEDDVRPGVIGRGVEAHRQEEGEGQHHAACRGHPRPEPEECSQADSQLRQRNDHADGHGEAEEVPEQRVQRADPGGGDQLGLDARRAVGVEEVRVGQLLQSGEAERESQERPQGQQRPPREGERPRRRRVESGAPAAPWARLASARTLCMPGHAVRCDGSSPLCHASDLPISTVPRAIEAP